MCAPIKAICNIHRYTWEIPEPAPFLSWHEAQIGRIWVFPVIKITVVRQVHITQGRYIEVWDLPCISVDVTDCFYRCTHTVILFEMEPIRILAR